MVKQMDFSNAMRTDSHRTYTENGAQALNTTENACLDLFATIGALRDRNETEVSTLFAEAYKADPLLATKTMFYARDIREGLGERKVFRDLLRYCAIYHPEAIKPNLDLIGVYGRYDDMYSLIGTPLEENMWLAMKAQFEEDYFNMKEGLAVSLLAKWIKTPDASSKETRKLGIQTAIKLGFTVYTFKRMLRELRKHLDIVERHMSAREWDKIKYPEVPSRAMMLYRNAFMKHDTDRFKEFTNKAVTGDVKINSSTLYPYDLIKQVREGRYTATTEAQWRQLPNYVEPGTNAIVMADTSGSMTWNGARPIDSAVGLAIYFAEHNTGAYHNLFMTFSASPSVIELRGETLPQKFKRVYDSDVGLNTNLEAAFVQVLMIAVKNHVSQEEMVKSIIVISDMEIDEATNPNSNYYALDSYSAFINKNHHSWDFYGKMKAEYARYGYEIPNIIFWNVNSRHDVFHADSERKGVQLVSGQSTTTFKQLVGCIGMTPVEMMLKVLNSDRYEAITIE